MTSSLGRPKRAGEEFTRTHYGGEAGPASKKPRFDPRNPSALAPDALEDDEVLEVDEIGRRGQQIKRNAINLDGYDSDSENENFNTRAAAKHRKAEKREQEEQDDMFADLDDDLKDGDENDPDEQRRDKKAVRFLHDDEIQGQVTGSKSGGHVRADLLVKGDRDGENDDIESSSDSEVDDETRAALGDDIDEELGAGSKKSHAPKLDAFNMRSEQEEGKFDEHGNYVRKAIDPDAIHDLWMEGISKKDIKKAAEAAQKRDQDRRQKDLLDDSKLTGDLLATLIANLEKGETSLEALARLGKTRDKKPKWQTKQKNRKKQDNGTSTNDNGDMEMHEEDPTEARRKTTVEALTDAADILLSRGLTEIYDSEREILVRLYRREAGQDWKDPPTDGIGNSNDESGPKMWEYRWSDGRDGGEIHGPYDGSTMSQWNDAGYFGEGVEFKRTGLEDQWSRHVDFV